MTTPAPDPIATEPTPHVMGDPRPWILATAIAATIALSVGGLSYMQHLQIQELKREAATADVLSLVEPTSTEVVVTPPEYLTFDGWTFVSARPAIEDRPMAQDNLIATFEGGTRVDGEVIYTRDAFDGEEHVCMKVFGIGFNNDPAIPSVVGVPSNERTFCFSNIDLAVKSFGPTYGRTWAVVEIDGYELASAPAEVRDMTRFVAVTSKEMTVTESELSADFPIFCPPGGMGPSESVSATTTLIQMGCADSNWTEGSTLVRDTATKKDIVTWTFASHGFGWQTAGGKKHTLTAIADRAWDSYVDFGSDQPVTVSDLQLDGTPLSVVAKPFVYADGALGPFQNADFDVDGDYTGGILTFGGVRYDVTFEPPSIIVHR